MLDTWRQAGPWKCSKECQEKVADVVFLLDSSYSIWQHQFSTQISFLKDLVTAFTIGPNNIRVGVVTFSTSVRLDMALNEHMNQPDLREAIGQIQYMKGLTRTGDAIHFAHTKMFTTDLGSRPWAAHILILITDGLSSDSNQTTLEASIARSKGIQLFAIGVGGGADEKELRAIASDPDDAHVFHVENYDALKEIEKSLAQKTCHRTNSSESAGGESGEQSGQDSEDMATKRCGGKPADIYFLLDSSSSIWSVDFKEELQFVAQLLQLFDMGGNRTRVGVAVYSDEVVNVVSLSDPQNVHSVHKALKTAPYLTGGTNTGKALNYVRTQGFSVARQEVAHVIIVLTDGQSANTTHTLLEAHAAHAQGIYVFSVGIGSLIDVEELMEIASDPDEHFMFHVDNFGGLQTIRDLLAIKACDVQQPDYQGDQPASEDCRSNTPTDVLFVYDAASVSGGENEVISEVISNMVQTVDPDPRTVRFGLVRQNCYKGDNIDLRTGADIDVLQAHLKKSIHHGLRTLLKRVRLQGHLDSRSRSRKVMVLLVREGSLTGEEAKAVKRELLRLKFKGVEVVMVWVGMGGGSEHLDTLSDLAAVPPVVVDVHDAPATSGQRLVDAFCHLNRQRRSRRRRRS
ncbi:hypothetical protein ACOMHN_024779 [Nucella lapillus]